MGKIKSPIVLTDDVSLSEFDCGNDVLNEWLEKRALKNQENGASRTFIISNGLRAIGYYALASGSIERLYTPGNISRNMPEPIPVTILARLAIDKQFQKQNLGAALLKDAMLRTLTVSQNIGTKAMMVHAISNSAKLFYQNYGYMESPQNPMLLFLSVKRITALLGELNI